MLEQLRCWSEQPLDRFEASFTYSRGRVFLGSIPYGEAYFMHSLGRKNDLCTLTICFASVGSLKSKLTHLFGALPMIASGFKFLLLLVVAAILAPDFLPTSLASHLDTLSYIDRSTAIHFRRCG